jgi:hypothetical protein
MRQTLIVLSCFMTPSMILQGCQTLGGSGIQRGTLVTAVQKDLGYPHVISDQNGLEVRFYTPSRRPAEEWPADSPRTYYYMDRDLAVKFVYGKAVEAGKIDPKLRDHVLPRLRDQKEPATQPD